MLTKSHQRIPLDTVHKRDRTNTNATAASKQTYITMKRQGGGGDTVQPRSNSGTTRISSGATSTTLGTDPQLLNNLQSSKIITEVDDTNIDEVLSLSDLSLIPVAFLTEIQQDEIYETILEELRKKMPDQFSSKALAIRETADEQKSFLPHLRTVNDVTAADDDDVSVDDEVSSSTSSENDDERLHEGYDTDIDTESVVQNYHDATGRKQYRELCQDAKIVPCSYFMAHIQDNEMILRYHQFNTEDIRAIAKILSTNLSVERLFLDGNYLQEQASKYITKLILTNDSIRELSLADNRLGGDEGTKEICKMLTLNRNLKKINLSGNKFNELDVVQLVEAFEKNKVLRELDLSHNCFGEECGEILGKFISTNDSLESIDLSWNMFRGKSAVDILNGIKDNIYIKRCSLEMNGLGPDSGQALANCIRQNGALEEFNINGNRLNTSNAFAIAQALLSNDSLEVLKLANNQINCDGALAVFLGIKANETSAIREVDFSDTVVTQETLNICNDIAKLKNGKFKYHVGKMTPEKLQPNSTSECYVKTDEELLNRLRSNAASVKMDAD